MFQENVRNNAYYGSIFTHNLDKFFNDEKMVRESILEALNDDEREELNSLLRKINKDNKNKKFKSHEEYMNAWNNTRHGYADKLRGEFHILSKEEALDILKLCLEQIFEFARKNNVMIPGFRFAINGGKSITSKNISFNSWPFIVKRKNDKLLGVKKTLIQGYAGVLHYSRKYYPSEVWTEAQKMVSELIGE